MQTNDLIRSLVADLDVPAPKISSRFAVCVAAGLAVAAVGFAVTLGPRPDIASAAGTVRFDMKIVLALLLFAAATILALRWSRPTARAGLAGLALAAATLLYPLAAAVELMLVPRAQWAALTVGSNALICLPAIVTMALPILAAAIYALRLGAPAWPGATGAAAGLLAGGLAAVLYATHCTDDSPLFVFVWYGLSFAIVAGIGWLAGRVWLRW